MKKILSIFLIIILIILIFLFTFWKLFPIKYKDKIVEYTEYYNLAPELVSSLINAESSFDKDSISSAGAVGLMQILPTTAVEIAEKLGRNGYDLHNPSDNIEFGCYYLKYLIDYYEGDIVYALCAYNAGLNNVSYWNFDGDIEKIPINQTKNYVKKILNNQKIYKLFYY